MTTGREPDRPDDPAYAALASPDARPGAELRIGRATVSDVERIAPLFDAYRQFYGAVPDLAAGRQFLAARLASNESVVLLGLATSSRPSGGSATPHGPPAEDVVGLAQLYHSFSSVSLGKTVILNDLYVVPAWRGCGVASRLVDAAAAYARDAGATRIELATQHANRSALRLYLRKGFAEDMEFTHLSLAVGSIRPVSGASRGR